MSTSRFATLLACLLALCVSTSLWAAKGNKKQSSTAPAPVPAAKYDADNNGLLDAKEKEALTKAFKDGSNPDLKRYDLNYDGTLSEEELGKISLKADEPTTGKKRKKNK